MDDSDPPDWAGWQRSWLTSMTGYSLIAAPERADALEQKLSERLPQGQLLIPITGYSRNIERMAEFLNLIYSGNQQAWYDAISLQVATVASHPDSADTVAYQLGNEITVETVSQALRAWAADNNITVPGNARAYDSETIPYYVEFYLAPAVQAARAASLTSYGHADAARIVLGSLGDGGTAEARQWLDELLNYQIVGTYAGALSGQRVYEVIDTVSVHYIGNTSNIEPIWNDWVGQGRIDSLWTTEEIGSRSATNGEGAGRAIRTLADQLHWLYSKDLTPADGRVAFYDWDVNGPNDATSAATSVAALYDFFGDTPFSTEETEVALGDEQLVFTRVRLTSTLDPNKRARAYWTEEVSAPHSISEIALSFADWNGSADIELTHFSPSGPRSEQHQLSISNGAAQLVLNQPAVINGRGHAILITAHKTQ